MIQHSKNCAIRISLKCPAGYYFDVLSTIYHGYASRDVNTTLTLQSTYSFSSDLMSTDIFGIAGGGDDYLSTRNATEVNLIRSPCASTPSILNLNVRASLTSTDISGKGQVPPVDALDSNLVQHVHLGWQTRS
jgi:hypothetical protein